MGIGESLLILGLSLIKAFIFNILMLHPNDVICLGSRGSLHRVLFKLMVHKFFINCILNNIIMTINLLLLDVYLFYSRKNS